MKILLFGRLRELLGYSAFEIAHTKSATLGELRQELALRGALWQEFIASENALAAINQTMALDTDPVAEGDEVAFFPPVTGG